MIGMGWAGVNQAFFKYDNDKDLNTCSRVTWLASLSCFIIVNPLKGNDTKPTTLI